MTALGAPPERVAWHALPAEEVLARAGARPEGLDDAEAERRRARHGPNVIAVRKPLSAWAVLRHQLDSIVVWLLAVAAGLALALDDRVGAAAIGVVLLINVVIGFWTEWRARVAVESLRRLQVVEAVVLRDGHRRKVDAAELVPGDVVLLAEGDAVPADGRLIEADELRVDESALTGESVPVLKDEEPVSEEVPGTTPLGDRTSMVYRGTTVLGGAGRAVVTATGGATELGRIGALVGSLAHVPTPIERRLDALGRRLVWIALGVAAVVVVLGLAQGADPWTVVETGLALAIAAVPEGLPVVATVTLAVGMWRMAARNALVRRPPAVEALGSATVICTDKTGTLTTSRMVATLVHVGGREVEVTGTGLETDGRFLVDGRPVPAAEVAGLAALARSAVLANEASLEENGADGAGATRAVGDPTDVALLVLGGKVGLFRPELLETAPEVGRLPFSSRRMLMASFHRPAPEAGGDGNPDGAMREGGADAPGHVEVHVKGAADRVLERCARWLGPNGEEPLDPAERARLLGLEERLAADGLRVIAVARGRASPATVGTDAALADLTFLGLVGLIDPPTEGVRETIARFRSAGLRTLMLTGDQPATAWAVARRAGMLDEGAVALSGVEISRATDEELRDAVGRAVVFGRIAPEDKLRIVEALQSRGEVVGMLGDGVNDAPALQRADIGVAMGGRGTDVARDVADLVLADDRLETVGVAVEEGRVIFDNIRKFIFYLFACNLSEVGVVLGASLAGLPLPLLPLQLLWLNVVTDVFPALALAAEPEEPDVMRRPPRPPGATILSRGFLRDLAGYALLITLVTLGVFGWGLRRPGGDLRTGVTLAFMTLAIAQLVHVLNAKRFGPVRTLHDLFGNPWMIGALVIGIGLQLLAVYQPLLRRVLGTVPLEGRDWLVVVGAALVPLVAGQGWKWWVTRVKARG